MVVMKIAIYDSYYYSGSIVRGNLVVTVDKPKKFNNIVISMTGNAQVRWTIHQGNATTTYRNSATYVDVQAILWARL